MDAISSCFCLLVIFYFYFFDALSWRVLVNVFSLYILCLEWVKNFLIDLRYRLEMITLKTGKSGTFGTGRVNLKVCFYKTVNKRNPQT